MSIDEWPERGTLRELPKPVNPAGIAGEGLRHAKHRQQETKDGDGSHQSSQAPRSVNEDEDCREINKQRGYLHNEETGREGIQRKPRGASEWQQLNHCQDDDSHQRPL